MIFLGEGSSAAFLPRGQTLLLLIADWFGKETTVAELGEMLPHTIKRNDGVVFELAMAKYLGDFRDEFFYGLEYRSALALTEAGGYEIEVQRCGESEANVRAEALIYLLENNLLKAEPKPTN